MIIIPITRPIGHDSIERLFCRRAQDFVSGLMPDRCPQEHSGRCGLTGYNFPCLFSEPGDPLWEMLNRGKEVIHMIIEVEFSLTSYFGRAGPEALGIDKEATSKRFAEVLSDRLWDAFGDADEIQVKESGATRYKVDGKEDHPQARIVGIIANEVWSQDWTWLVSA